MRRLLLAGALALLTAAAFAQTTLVGPPAFVAVALQYKNITTDATTTIKSSAGVLHTICLNKPVATTTITIYDNTAASGTLIGTITIPASPQPSCLTYDIAFTIGLTIVTGTAASDLTVSWL